MARFHQVWMSLIHTFNKKQRSDSRSDACNRIGALASHKTHRAKAITREDATLIALGVTAAAAISLVCTGAYIAGAIAGAVVIGLSLALAREQRRRDDSPITDNPFFAQYEEYEAYYGPEHPKTKNLRAFLVGMLEVGRFNREAAELRARGSIGYMHRRPSGLYEAEVGTSWMPRELDELDEQEEPSNIIHIARGSDGVMRAHEVVRGSDGRLEDGAELFAEGKR